MNEVGVFKTEKTLSNKTIIVSFSPSKNVKTYAYQIYKDNLPLGNAVSKTNTQTNITLNESGKYYIHVKATLDNVEKDIYSDIYTIDKEKPVINVLNDNLIIKKDIEGEIKQNVKALDGIDGNITSNIKTNLSDLNLKLDGTQKLTYEVVDRAGNIARRNINIKIVQNKSYMLIMLCIILCTLLAFTFIMSKVMKAIKLEKRISDFTVKSFKEKKSLSEKIIDKYKSTIKKMSKNFDKYITIKKYCKRLEKYLCISDIYENSYEIFAGKIITGLIFMLIVITIKLISLKFVDFYQLVVIFTISFFALDLLYFIKYKVYRLKLESEFISAITIMNNAFKSGRSITQAIDTVAGELKGPIGREFERMSLELLYGLGIDVVFKRFSKRINLEEANYLTASLTILNKTGGDIIKVFELIERSMFDKRKLRLELKSLTSGSKIVIGVLLTMPFFFCLVIGLINPEYFVPFFTTPIGIILLIFMIIYYIIFIVVVRKVMKVVV